MQLFSPNSPFHPFSPYSSSPYWVTPPTPPPSTTRRKPGPLTGFFRTDPLTVYVLSRHFKWRDEAERAAVGLLALSMDELEKQWKDLQEAKADGREGEEKDVITFMATKRDWELLVDLRKRRCDAFRGSINSREMFSAGNDPDYSCIQCGYEKLDNSLWDALKQVMLAEFEARPSGDTLLAALVVPPRDDDVKWISATGHTLSFADGKNAAASSLAMTETATNRRDSDKLWPELVSCFRARCPNKACGAVNYDPLATIKQDRKSVV